MPDALPPATPSEFSPIDFGTWSSTPEAARIEDPLAKVQAYDDRLRKDLFKAGLYDADAEAEISTAGADQALRAGLITDPAEYAPAAKPRDPNFLARQLVRQGDTAKAQDIYRYQSFLSRPDTDPETLERARVAAQLDPETENELVRKAVRAGELPFAVVPDKDGNAVFELDPELGALDRQQILDLAGDDIDPRFLPDLEKQLTRVPGTNYTPAQFRQSAVFDGFLKEQIKTDEFLFGQLEQAQTEYNRTGQLSTETQEALDRSLAALDVDNEFAPATRSRLIRDTIKRGSKPEAYDPENPQQHVQYLEDGTVWLPEQVIFDEATHNKVLDSLNVTPEQKENAKKLRAGRLESIAPAMVDAMGANPDALDFYETSKAAGKSDSEIATEWYSKPENYGSFANRARSFGMSLIEAGPGLFQSIAALAGSDSAREALAARAQDTARNEEYARLFGDSYGVGQSLLNTSSQVAADLLAGIAVSAVATPAAGAAVVGARAAGSSLLRGLARTAVTEGARSTAAGFIRSATGSAARTLATLGDNLVSKMAREAGGEVAERAAVRGATRTIAGQTGIAASSFTRSAGSAYVSTYSALDAQTNSAGQPLYSDEEKRKIALGTALVSGTSTAAITLGFGRWLGQGAEGLIAGGLSTGVLRRVVGMTDDQIISGVRQSALAVLHAAAVEAPEEATDQLIGGIIQKVATGEEFRLGPALKDALEAGLVGGLLGGGIGAVQVGIDKFRSPKVAALESSGSPVTAATLEAATKAKSEAPAAKPTIINQDGLRIQDNPPLSPDPFTYGEEDPDAPNPALTPSTPPPATDALSPDPFSYGIEESVGITDTGGAVRVSAAEIEGQIDAVDVQLADLKVVPANETEGQKARRTRRLQELNAEKVRLKAAVKNAKASGGFVMVNTTNTTAERAAIAAEAEVAALDEEISALSVAPAKETKAAATKREASLEKVRAAREQAAGLALAYRSTAASQVARPTQPQQTNEPTNQPPPTAQGDASRAAQATPDYTPESGTGTREVVTRKSDDIIAELQSLPGTAERMQWLVDRGYLTTVEGRTHVDYSGRTMVLMRVGNVNVPFYISSGMAGKKTVAAGRWYAVWGIGADGWINKGAESDINNQYGYPILQKLARILNEGIGYIDPDYAPALADEASINDQMNVGSTPAPNHTATEQFWRHVAQSLTRINEETGKLVAERDRSTAATSQPAPAPSPEATPVPEDIIGTDRAPEPPDVEVVPEPAGSDAEPVAAETRDEAPVPEPAAKKPTDESRAAEMRAGKPLPVHETLFNDTVSQGWVPTRNVLLSQLKEAGYGGKLYGTAFAETAEARIRELYPLVDVPKTAETKTLKSLGLGDIKGAGNKLVSIPVFADGKTAPFTNDPVVTSWQKASGLSVKVPAGVSVNPAIGVNGKTGFVDFAIDAKGVKIYSKGDSKRASSVVGDYVAAQNKEPYGRSLETLPPVDTSVLAAPVDFAGLKILPGETTESDILRYFLAPTNDGGPSRIDQAVEARAKNFTGSQKQKIRDAAEFAFLRELREFTLDVNNLGSVNAEGFGYKDAKSYKAYLKDRVANVWSQADKAKDGSTDTSAHWNSRGRPTHLSFFVDTAIKAHTAAAKRRPDANVQLGSDDVDQATALERAAARNEADGPDEIIAALDEAFDPATLAGIGRLAGREGEPVTNIAVDIATLVSKVESNPKLRSAINTALISTNVAAPGSPARLRFAAEVRGMSAAEVLVLAGQTAFTRTQLANISGLFKSISYGLNTFTDAEIAQHRADNRAAVADLQLDGDLRSAIERIARSARYPRRYRAIALAALKMSVPPNIAIVDAPTEAYAGSYIHSGRLITLNIASSNGRGLLDVLAHELLHAATIEAVANPQTKTARDLVAKLERARQKAAEVVPSDMAYAVSSLDEFITHAATDPRLQVILRETFEKGKTTWQRVVEAIAKFFGIANNDFVSDLWGFINHAAEYGYRVGVAASREARSVPSPRLWGIREEWNKVQVKAQWQTVREALKEVPQDHPMYGIASMLAANPDLKKLDTETLQAVVDDRLGRGRAFRDSNFGGVISTGGADSIGVATLIHEVAHSLTADAIDTFVGVSPQWRGAQYLELLNLSRDHPRTPSGVRDIIDLYLRFAEEEGYTELLFGPDGVASFDPDIASRAGITYGMANINEFVAEAFSNPEFQNRLGRATTGRRTAESLWSKFVRAVRKIASLPYRSAEDAAAEWLADVEAGRRGEYSPEELQAARRDPVEYAGRALVDEYGAFDYSLREGDSTFLEEVLDAAFSIAALNTPPVGGSFVPSPTSDTGIDQHLPALPAGLAYAFDDTRPKYLAYARRSQPGTVTVNRQALAAAIEGLDPANARAIVSKVVKHEIAHLAAFSAFTDADISEMARGLSMSELGDIARRYYNSPDAMARLTADIGAGVMTSESLVEEYLRMQVEMISDGSTTEETIAFHSADPGFAARILRYIRDFVKSLWNQVAGPTDDYLTRVTINRLMREYRAIKRGHLPPVQPPFDPGDPYRDNRLGALATGDGTDPEAAVLSDFMRQETFIDFSGAHTEPAAGWRGTLKQILKTRSGDPRMDAIKNERTARITAANTLLANREKAMRRAMKEENPDRDLVNQALGDKSPTIPPQVRKDLKALFESDLQEVAAASADKQIDLDVEFANRLASGESREAALDWLAGEQNKLDAEERAARQEAYDKYDKARRQALAETAREKKARISEAFDALRAAYPKTADAVKKFRSAIDSMSAVMRDTHPEDSFLHAVLDENMGVYVTTTYRVHHGDADPLAIFASEDPADIATVAEAQELFVSTIIDGRAEEIMEEEAEAGKIISFAEAEELARAWADENEIGRKALEDYLASHGSRAFYHGGGNFKIDLTRYMQKGDVPEALRKVLGEVEDPVENAARTFANVSYMAANHRFIEDLARGGKASGALVTKGQKDGFADLIRMTSEDEYIQGTIDFGFARRTPTTGYVQVADGVYHPMWLVDARDKRDFRKLEGYESLATTNKKYGAGSLDGLYAPPLVKAFFENAMPAKPTLESEKLVHRFGSFFAKATGASLGVATVTNPGFHTRNMLGGAFFLMANGINPFRNIGVVMNHFGDLVKGQDNAEVLKRIALGIYSNDTRPQAIKELIKDETDRPGDRSGFEWFGNLIGGKRGLEVGKKITSGALKLTDFAGAVDSAIKGMAYEAELRTLREAHPDWAQDRLERAAADIILRTHQARSMTVPIAEDVTRSSFGRLFSPFLRFRAEMFRITHGTIMQSLEEIKSDNPVIQARGRERLAGFVMVSALSLAGPALVSAMFGVGGDEEEALRESLPPYLKGNSLTYFTSNGSVTSLDMTFVNPYSNLFDPVSRTSRALFRGEPGDAAGEVAAWMSGQLLDEQIAAGAALEVLNNRTSDNKPIVLDTDGFVESTVKYSKHLLSSAYTPQVLKTIDRAIEAQRRGVPETAEMFETPAGLLASSVLPVRGRTFQTSDMALRAFKSKAQTLRDIRTLSGQYKRRQNLDEQDINGITEDIHDSMVSLYEDLDQIARGFEGLGMEKADIIKQMVNAGHSREKARGVVVRGVVPAPALTPATKRDIFDAGEAVSPDGGGARRVRLVRESQQALPRTIDLRGPAED